MSFEANKNRFQYCLYCSLAIPIMDLAQHVQDQHPLQVGKSKVERITALDTVKILEEGSKLFHNMGKHAHQVLSDELVDHMKVVASEALTSATDWFIVGKEVPADKFWKTSTTLSKTYKWADWRGVVGTMDDRCKQSEADKKVERGGAVIPDALRDMVKAVADAVPVAVELVTVSHLPAECVYVIKVGSKELKVKYEDLDTLPKATLDRLAHELGQKARTSLGVARSPFNVLTPRGSAKSVATTTADMSKLLAPGLKQIFDGQHGDENVQYKELMPKIAQVAKEDADEYVPPKCAGCMALAQRVEEMRAETIQLPDGNFVKDLQALRDRLMAIVVKVAEGDKDAQAEARRLLDGDDDD
jgi:hypothetical protein